MKGKRVGFCSVMVVSILFFAIQAVAAGMEIPDINACEVVTGDEVAALAGAKLLVKPGSTSFFCNYTVEKLEGGVESYQLTFESPDQAKVILDNISGDEKGEKIEGVLDEAYLGRDAFNTYFELRALRPDKIGMNVTGDRKEVVLQIAKLAVTRLPEAIPLRKM
jgi:hypothetical protein